MRKATPQIKKSVQEIQDNIFRKMSADEKIKISSRLWQLAKVIDGKKVIDKKIEARMLNKV